jgi:DNA polymerase-3 subunit alpha
LKHANFVHLHVHTQYSLLDGAIRFADLLDKAREYHMPALSITDHGNMFGTIEFYQKARNAGIKPIIGCEMYLSPTSRFDKEAHGGVKATNHHLVLLAKNKAGYQNLLKLVTAAYREGFYYRPRIDKELLKDHNEGLIALSACLHGEVPTAVLSGNAEKARELVEEYSTIFDNNRFYLELQENGIADQKIVNNGLIEISKEMSIPLVATNDCHYLNKTDAKAHEVLLCIQTGKTMSAPDRMHFTTDEFHFKSPDEMKETFAHVPEAISNTIAIAEQCNLEIPLKDYIFPHFDPPGKENNEELFERLSREGLQKRIDKLQRTAPDYIKDRLTEYQERLEVEIKMIRKMKFTTYFLIVSDFINYSKENKIPVGPGRGSAAGSLVAYSLKITEIDPIKNGLLFERFLNPERVNPPDIDVDFCMNGRDKVIEYVTQKYGKDKVAQIITFGKMLAKGVIRDVGRALDMPYSEVDKIAKLIPNDLGITIDKAIVMEPKLKELIKSDSQVANLITVARALEGLTRHSSTHAAGVVIADAPLENYVPLFKNPKDEEFVTQYPMNDVDSIGLIKFDFLGLRTLTVIDTAVTLVLSDAKNSLPDINDLPLDDLKTYELLSLGETEGIFQLESSGMKELLTRIKPDCIEDLTALLALYRPGPLGSGMVDNFIDGKSGKIKIKYDLPQLEDILKETYGIILYQEQVMKIASTLASFSLADADLLRRAMGKKKPAEMAKQKKKFLEGAKKNKFDLKKAEKIFDLMAKFAEYGFNKSHSAAYAYVSFQTAYLKAHFPVEFMAALLSSEMDNTDKVVKHISECKEKGIEILPPDVNESYKDFTVPEHKIRFGLAAIKNVGLSAIESIIEAREKDGKFVSLFDFCNKVDLRKVNKKVIESLIKCGAFDSFKMKRSQLMAVFEEVVAAVQRIQKEKEKNQMSMFEAIAETTGTNENEQVNYPDISEWDQKECLAYEKECLGFYITGHPLDNYRQALKAFTNVDTASALAAESEREIRIGGMISTIKKIITKKGDPMAFISFEDLSGTIEVILFPETFRNYDTLLEADHPLLIKGKLTFETDNNNKIIASEIVPLDQAHEIATPDIHLKCSISKLGMEQVEKVKNTIKNNPGKSKIFLHVVIPGKSETIINLGDAYLASASGLFTTEIESTLGKNSVNLN